jgi:hypothetical protein
MSKSLFALLIGYFCFSGVYAQSTVSHQASNGIRVSPTFSIIYPGLNLGFEQLRSSDYVTMGRRKPVTPFFSERYLNYTLGFYHHPTFHTNVFATVDWVKRNQRLGGLFTDFSFGGGVSRTFFDGPTFKVNDDNTVEQVQNAGDFYAVFQTGYAVGYNFGIKYQNGPSLYAKANLMFFFPYNNAFYARPFFELGAIFKLPN